MSLSTLRLLLPANLILQKETTPGVWEDVYRSAGMTGSVDHIYLPELSLTGNYRIDVHAADIIEPELGETYALAVSYSAVPEPGTAVFPLLGVGIISFPRPKRNLV